jgi:large subunit ribosomal protein L17
MVTKAKKRDNVMAVRLLSPELTSPAVKKMIASIAPRFSTRDGGYTRIIKKGNRFNDNASMVLLEWVEKASAVAVDIIAPAASVKKSVKANVASEAVVVKKAVVKKSVAKKAPAKEKKA